MFNSFFMAGFEGSTGYNKSGDWFDQVVATGHDRTVEADYAAIAEVGLRTARETVRWPLVDLGRGRYDFSTVDPFIEAARSNEVDVIWDLFHYGYPRGLDLLDDEFPRRFADYCFHVARHIDVRTEGVCYFTPVNEPSFMAYAGGDAALFAPHMTGRGWDLKVRLCQAAIQGIEAIWAASPGARIVNVDPLCRVAQHPERPQDFEAVRHFNEAVVYQSWDMLSGRLLPELGGSMEHLDIVGINYYWTNQWEWGTEPLPDGRIPPLCDHDPRRASLSALVRQVWERFGRDLLISETAAVGERRGRWMLEVAGEAEKLLRQGVPLRGICLYPILGMPEWHEPDVWTPMGLWDPVCHRDPCGDRLVCEPMLEALLSVQGVSFREDRAKARRAPAYSGIS